MPNIHPTALISDDAQLADDVTVGPHAIIDGPAVIGPGCTIAANAWIAGRVEMGSNNSIGYGAVIGSDPQAFSFDPASDTGVSLGSGNTIREYVTINRGTTATGLTSMGDENFIMIGSHLAHDVRLGNKNAFANNVMLAGHVEVGNQVFIGGGAGFHQFLFIGDLAMVAGHASISKDVPPFCMTTHDDTLAGLNVVGLRRAGLKQEQRTEIKRLYGILFRREGSLQDALAEAQGQSWSEYPTRLLHSVANPSKRGVMG
jgi:UDP-N-acetylglucosamine acyltransferase